MDLSYKFFRNYYVRNKNKLTKIIVMSCMHAVTEARSNGGGNKTSSTQKTDRHGKAIQHDRCFLDSVHDS